MTQNKPYHANCVGEIKDSRPWQNRGGPRGVAGGLAEVSTLGNSGLFWEFEFPLESYIRLFLAPVIHHLESDIQTNKYAKSFP